MTSGVIQKWFAADVICNSDSADAVEEALNLLDPRGIETDLLGKKAGESIRVTAYFDDLPADDSVTSVLEGVEYIRLEIREVEQTDWLAEWKKHWRATEIGKFVIAPPWENVDTDKIVIRIEPNMAFGTGTHPTTQLCLAAISDDYRAGESFLDVGCGTGILSIAAAKMNGDRTPAIFGCDTDAHSVSIARENATLNGAGAKIQFADGPIGTDIQQFDFTCANVTLDVIVPMLEILIAKTKRILVLSGILVDQRSEIEESLAGIGITDPTIDVSGEWLAVRLNA